MGKFKDLIGKKFGKLLVLELRGKNRYGYMKWHCKCECGNTVDIPSSSLLNGHTKSCGCLTKKNLTGKRFGKLTVLYENGIDLSHNRLWHCKCDCGGVKDVPTYLLTNGEVRSCGCLASELLTKRNKDQCIKLRKYPQWFLDDLVYDKDKEKALSHELYTGDKVWFKCDIHGDYKQRVADHITLSNGERRSGCPKCSGLTPYVGSKSENDIKEYLLSLDNLLNIQKERILDYGSNMKEIDIYISSLNIGIEYNGSAFHASINGFRDDKDRLYHRDKYLQAEKQGIHLINIFDVDWKNNQDKIKQYLHDLIVPCKKIFARKCELKVIDKKLANEFTDKYHIQGKGRMNSINYGLYNNNELLAVMSFGKLRMAKSEDGQYELHRYCVKAEYNIIGGANKLLKAFEREYSPRYIVSYSDNDYFTGNIYPILGFEFEKHSTPRYYWYFRGEEIKRERCQLKHLKEEYPELLQEAYDTEASNKEDYVMTKLGACKVYRSGTKKWVKTYE